MAKLVSKSLDDFLNEVSNEYIAKKTQQAREQGRKVTPDYEQSLKDKNTKTVKPKPIEADGLNTFVPALKQYVEQKKLPWKVDLFSNGKVYLMKQDDNGKSTNEMIVYISPSDTLQYYNNEGKSLPLAQINNVIPLATLSKLIQQSFPKSQYADRRIWSSL